MVKTKDFMRVKGKKLIKGFICDNCGYGWIPRLVKPKKCPSCGSRSWDRSVGA